MRVRRGGGCLTCDSAVCRSRIVAGSFGVAGVGGWRWRGGGGASGFLDECLVRVSLMGLEGCWMVVMGGRGGKRGG
jgi:hypothetical protein